MPFFLTDRAENAKELMDDPNCDREELFNTYRQFGVINSLISQWSKIYQQHIIPICKNLDRPCTLLDIGFGGGDIPINIAKWAQKDGLKIEITAIETDKRAYKYIQDITPPDNIVFKLISSTELLAQGNEYDIVISNHLLHHLDQSGLAQILEESKKLSRHAVLFNDLERSDIAYGLFNILSRPIFRSSFITRDGLTSIKRSYTKDELRQVAPNGWKVHRLFPFRLLLSYSHE
ncbi:MAG: methyltransferase domain-containing protein [Balneolaceae bacterium]|nr:methyltransferase domain-containing protein [Balneolaceae bacterium]